MPFYINAGYKSYDTTFFRMIGFLEKPCLVHQLQQVSINSQTGTERRQAPHSAPLEFRLLALEGMAVMRGNNKMFDSDGEKALMAFFTNGHII